MSTRAEFMTFVADQLQDAGAITARKMFGEYAVYLDAKVVALVCDDQLFVKPTAEGKVFLRRPKEAPPYPGAKPHFLIEELDDAERLCELVKITAAALPAPNKPKRKAGRR